MSKKKTQWKSLDFGGEPEESLLPTDLSAVVRRGYGDRGDRGRGRGRGRYSNADDDNDERVNFRNRTSATKVSTSFNRNSGSRDGGNRDGGNRDGGGGNRDRDNRSFRGKSTDDDKGFGNWRNNKTAAQPPPRPPPQQRPTQQPIRSSSSSRFPSSNVWNGSSQSRQTTTSQPSAPSAAASNSKFAKSSVKSFSTTHASAASKQSFPSPLQYNKPTRENVRFSRLNLEPKELEKANAQSSKTEATVPSEYPTLPKAKAPPQSEASAEEKSQPLTTSQPPSKAKTKVADAAPIKKAQPKAQPSAKNQQSQPKAQPKAQPSKPSVSATEVIKQKFKSLTNAVKKGKVVKDLSIITKGLQFTNAMGAFSAEKLGACLSKSVLNTTTYTLFDILRAASEHQPNAFLDIAMELVSYLEQSVKVLGVTQMVESTNIIEALFETRPDFQSKETQTEFEEFGLQYVYPTSEEERKEIESAVSDKAKLEDLESMLAKMEANGFISNIIVVRCVAQYVLSEFYFSKLSQYDNDGNKLLTHLFKTPFVNVLQLCCSPKTYQNSDFNALSLLLIAMTVDISFANDKEHKGLESILRCFSEKELISFAEVTEWRFDDTSKNDSSKKNALFVLADWVSEMDRSAPGDDSEEGSDDDSSDDNANPYVDDLLKANPNQ